MKPGCGVEAAVLIAYLGRPAAHPDLHTHVNRSYAVPCGVATNCTNFTNSAAWSTHFRVNSCHSWLVFGATA